MNSVTWQFGLELFWTHVVFTLINTFSRFSKKTSNLCILTLHRFRNSEFYSFDDSKYMKFMPPNGSKVLFCKAITRLWRVVKLLITAGSLVWITLTLLDRSNDETSNSQQSGHTLCKEVNAVCFKGAIDFPTPTKRSLSSLTTAAESFLVI